MTPLAGTKDTRKDTLEDALEDARPIGLRYRLWDAHRVGREERQNKKILGRYSER